MMRVTLFLALVLLALAPLGAAMPAPDRSEPVVRYTVKQGDTLIGLADGYMNGRSDYLVVQQTNGLRDPNRLTPGSVLVIPVRVLRGAPLTAKVLSFRGSVTLENPGSAIKAGAQLGEGTLIRTGANAFVTLQAADGSKITVPSQSALRLSRMRRLLLTGSVDQEFSVERGRAETSVVPQRNPNDGYRFRTPIAVSAVRGTEFRIGYEGGPSRTEVLGGTVAVAPNGASPIAVPRGIGAGVSADGKVATETLLPGPVLLNPDAPQSDTLVAFRVAPVANAAQYRVQLASDAGFTEIFDERLSDTPTITFTDVPDGRFFARVTAISTTHFEGLPAVYPFSRRLGILRTAGVTADRGHFRFMWQARGSGALRYRFQLMREQPDAIPFVDQAGLSVTETSVAFLTPGTYYWRVGMVQADGGPPIEKWTAPQRLVVEPLAERR